MNERLEGRISVLAAIEARQRKIEAILVSSSAKADKIQDVLDAAEKRKILTRTLDESELGAQSKTHGGVVAICSPKPMTTAEELYRLVESLRTPPFLVLIEGADDARNLGYVLRTAEAFGVHAIILRRRAWDLDSTTVSRASSGAFERLPLVLVERELEEVPRLRKHGLKFIGCMPNARQSIYDTDLTGPLILAIGGEKRGLSNAVRSRCTATVSIPTQGGPTSLSMTQASAIAIAEVMRQRKK